NYEGRAPTLLRPNWQTDCSILARTVVFGTFCAVACPKNRPSLHNVRLGARSHLSPDMTICVACHEVVPIRSYLEVFGVTATTLNPRVISVGSLRRSRILERA